MAKIKKVTITFDEVDMTGVMKFKVYYDIVALNELSPFVEIPAVSGQTAYPVEFPTMIPIGEGTYNLGVVAVDEAGNESDMDVMSSFFDFTPPGKPTWRK